MIELENKNKISSRDKWKYCNIILLLPLLEVNNYQPLLHMPKSLFILIIQKKILTNLKLYIW